MGGVTPVPPERHLLRAKDVVDARFREPLDVPALARAAYLSPAHLSREFRRAFGETPHQYLLTRRLERASVLLRNTDRSVADICFLVGLRSVGSFTTSFRRVYGMSPTAYRARPPAARACPPPDLRSAGLRASAQQQFSRRRERGLALTSLSSTTIERSHSMLKELQVRAGLGSRPGRGAGVLHRKAGNGAAGGCYGGRRWATFAG